MVDVDIEDRRPIQGLLKRSFTKLDRDDMFIGSFEDGRDQGA
jgi:hypothetical protein